jgi:hypothetical protein
MPDSTRSAFPAPRELPARPSTGEPRVQPTREEMLYLLACAESAPSGGNFQPWKVVFSGGELQCRIAPEQGDYFANFRGNELYISLGAAVANLEVAAASIGFDTTLEPFPSPEEPELAGTIRFSAASERDERACRLAEQIAYRVSSRKVEERQPLSDEDRVALEEIAEAGGAGLTFLTDDRDLKELGELLGRMNQMAYLNQESHRGIMKILRWTEEEAADTRDGIPVTTFELSPLEISGLRFISKFSVMKFVNNMGAGKAIDNTARVWAETSSAVGLLTVADKTPDAFFYGGRCLERLWLEATRRDLAFHILGLLSFFDRLAHDGEGFDEDECATLRQLRDRFEKLFPVSEGHVETVLFRVLPPNPLVDRTYRRGVESMARLE